MKRLLMTAAAVALAPLASGQTVFVNEDFESYGSQSAFEQQWIPQAGDGFGGGAAGSADLILSGAPEAVVGQMGNAATGIAGQINEDAGGFSPEISISDTGYQIVPSATESIVVRGDLYAGGGQSNALAEEAQSFRQTLGLRSDIFDRDPDPGITAAGVNFVELGFYNTDSCVPTNPGCVGPDPGDPEADPPVEPTEGDPEFRPNGDFMFRLVLFDSSTLGNYFENGVDQGTMVQSPNWANFPLDPALDDGTALALPATATPDADGFVNLIDIGDGWHTYEATISETDVTLTLDLYRDGINNATGAPGVDSEVVVEVGMAASFSNAPFDLDPAPMNSLRIGAPSGIASDAGTAIYDNIYLALEEAMGGEEPILGDFNNDGAVDNADLNLLLNNWGSETVPAEWINSFTANPGVNNDELNALLNTWGQGIMTAVPEPTSLVLVSVCGLFAVARRR
ncbi:MAG: PEP-CTERM sorting domain-containing protein [Planctomycetota bacterium]